MTAWLWGALLAAAVAFTARRVNALSLDGAIAAFVLGTIVFGAGGLAGALVLLAFFIPSSLLTRVGRERKRRTADSDHTARTSWQVLANGGVAALCILCAAIWRGPFAPAFAGALAAASADTWATEIGTLSSRAPVSIVTFRPVQTGISGGVSALGIAASIAGALCVAVVAWFCRLAPLAAVATGGVAGSLIDSFLGATLQARRRCNTCAMECESATHRCGDQTAASGGISWLQNDAVNLCATICGALVAAAIAMSAGDAR
jgi:uncharacterized protein (TIGR00297 family)